MSSPHGIEKRSPEMVLLFSLITCGVYLMFWYAGFYRDLKKLTGKTPTGLPYLLDLLIYFLTAGLYGIYVDYQMSRVMYEYEVAHNLPSPKDTMTPVLMLGLAAYLTGYLTNFLNSAIHQDQLNKIMIKLG